MTQTFEGWWTGFNGTQTQLREEDRQAAEIGWKAAVADRDERIRKLERALGDLLSAHHHSRGDEWVDAAYAAIAAGKVGT